MENAFDIIVTSEVNGADTLEFSLPFHDTKRAMLDNEKQVQIVNDIYCVRTLTDTKDADGRILTQVYAEAAFYDLSFSEEKGAVDFNADTAEAAMRHVLELYTTLRELGDSSAQWDKAADVSPKGYERLRFITVRLCVTDCTGQVYFTDMLLQGGSIATGWVAM